ncbi:MAG TPA: hypothetical protein VIZ69_14100 [Thermoanaerobaculia bacterium]
MRRFVSSIALLAVLAAPGALVAHEGHHHVLGTVIGVEATRVQVRTKDGKTVAVPVNAGTKYFRGSKGNIAAAASDVKVGMRVVIDLAKGGSAEEVRLPSTKSTK